MEKEDLQKRAKYLVRELEDLQMQLDILQDDIEIGANGCSEEDLQEETLLWDMSNQVRKSKYSVSEAVNHLAWIF